MRRRLVLAGLLVAASFLGACGDDGAGDPDTPAGTGPPAEGGLALSAGPSSVAPGAVSWVVTVVNGDDEPVTLEFPTGQSAEVTLRQDGGEVYRWGADQAFTQAMRSVELAAGEELVFELADPAFDVPAGEYERVVTLTATNVTVETTDTVTVD